MGQPPVSQALQVVQKSTHVKEPDLASYQRLMDTHQYNLPEEAMCRCLRIMALHMRGNSDFGRTSQHLLTFPALWQISQESFGKTWSPNQTFCLLSHGLALISTSTKFYTMQIKREINKATTKQWRSLFEMLYQENSNRERRLNSKRMTGVAPIKTAAVWWGSRGSSRKRGNLGPVERTQTLWRSSL